MNTPARLAAFGGLIALTFGAALGVGAAVGTPIPTGDAGHSTNGHPTNGHGTDGHPTDAHADADRAMPGTDHAAGQGPGGLAVAESGYRLVLGADRLQPGTRVPLTFTVIGPDGNAVTRYEPKHEKDLHLIAVRRDLTGFQHVHPSLDGTGTWTSSLDLDPGAWRVFADFVPGSGPRAGESLTLGSDLHVPGGYDPVALPAPAHTSEPVEGYTATLDGQLVAGRESILTLSIAHDGRPVTDLDPYLAAYGHLVALRVGDLAYLHVHPEGHPGDGTTRPGPAITFAATAPSSGDYRIFLDVKHHGVVRTLALTVRATDPDAKPSPTGSATPAPTSSHAH
ncbi:hypothetical protein N865_15005 [Intrasporangium oryzae NRRL B-24470]|uniref:Heavy metal-binding domain-containing protein n=2 Tax=Intrasporangium TaxID=53357 RepID=W9G9J6_9MICO|nr:hypothetical protein N865_15005 [Intrasporangium oryzae NRRL B-24470]